MAERPIALPLVQGQESVIPIEVFARPQIPIPHTDCPKCDAPMYLARIAPDKFGYDERTFECSECDHSITEVEKYR